jgi:putative glutamine amidotransferase
MDEKARDELARSAVWADPTSPVPRPARPVRRLWPTIAVTGPDHRGWVLWAFSGLAVRRAGGRPLAVTPRRPPADLARIGGLVLVGGADVDPALYGQENVAARKVDPPRDRLELGLIRWAMENRKPILGICRGAQLLNVALGGTLHQHLPDLLGHDRHRASAGTDALAADASAYGRHDVVVKPGSRAHALLGQRLTVNSFHHQGVDDPGEFLATGWCPDDRVLEIIEHPSLTFALGVQWHPERTGDLRVFAALNEAAARRSGLSRPALAA